MPPTIQDRTFNSRLQRIKLIVTDVDGVLTDGSAWFSETGLALKRFSMRDGFGFTLARFAGIEMAALTGNVAGLVRQRLEPFGIRRILGGHFRKVEFFNELLQDFSVDASEALYIGDDLFDLPVMERAGLGVAPSDAHARVLDAADASTSAAGGQGVFREVIEALLEARGEFDSVFEAIQNDPHGGRLP